MDAESSLPESIRRSIRTDGVAADGITILMYIQRAVERASQAPAIHVSSVPVIAKHGRKILWSGNVEIFKCAYGRAYGWAVEGDTEPRYIVSLNEPGVDSAESAVKAWIVAQAQKK